MGAPGAPAGAESRKVPVTASDRLLTILRSFNEMGSCTVLELHQVTGISRTAVYRAVETLCAHGYVRRVPDDNHYRLTSEIRQLSSGYRDEEWIVEAGAPVIERLQRRFLWPTSLSTIDKDRMVIRETTRYRSPFVFDTGAVGRRLPVLTTAMGIAFLAFCSPPSRRIVLDLLRDSADPLDELARDARKTERLLRGTARRGYAYRRGGIRTNTSSIARPVMGEDGAVGAVCITFATSAVSQHEALAQFLPALREAAAEISAYAGTPARTAPRA